MAFLMIGQSGFLRGADIAELWPRIPLSFNRRWLLKIATTRPPRAANLRNSLDTLCCSLDAECAAGVTHLDSGAPVSVVRDQRRDEVPI